MNCLDNLEQYHDFIGTPDPLYTTPAWYIYYPCYQVAGNILLYGNNIVMLIMFTDVMYPDHIVDVVTVTIIELS